MEARRRVDTDEAGWLRAEGLTKVYRGKGGEVEVFRDLDFEIHKGELAAIVGESGAGKSTLLHLLGGLDRPTGGTVFLGKFDIVQARELDLSRFRNRQIGFVFQFHHLLSEFTALENVMMPDLIAGSTLRDSRERARQLLDRVGVAKREGNRPGELSGGEQQRVAIARALASSPQLLLADGPTGNLDSRTGESIEELIRSLQVEQKLTAVIVTHNQRLASRCDRVFQLDGGQLSELQT
jgi:lipoprotein-releasing system ATP-binding protein